MEKILIFGHKNPDTDTICSALAYEYILKDKMNVQAVRLGELNAETKYVLKYANVDAPNLITDVKNRSVILVDHNEFNQSADFIEDANIIQVIDHHRIGNFKTNEPIFMNIQPVGCTATILLEMSKKLNRELSKDIALLMLSAIISDTLMFKSPTSTKTDESAAKELALIAEVDLETYAMEMLKAGTDLTCFDVKEILNMDSKQFESNGMSFKVAQVSTLGIDELLLKYETDFIDLMSKDDSFDLNVLLITDIMKCDSVAIVVGEQKHYFENKFNVKLENNKVLLKGVVSRKKQIVPFL